MKTIITYFDKPHIMIRNSLFFDIETTGLSHSGSIVFLIGTMYYDEEKEKYVLKQNIIFEISEERLLLEDFIEQVQLFERIISFNGTSFDIPFIKDRCVNYNIDINIVNKPHLDLYTELRSLKKFLGIDNFKLSSASKAAGFNRIDNTSGGEVIEIFHEYVKEASLCRVTGTETDNCRNLRSMLLRHNSDDVEALIYIYGLKAYKDILEKNFFDIRIEENDSILILTVKSELPFSKKMNFADEHSSLHLCDECIMISLKKIKTSLKLFYKDYKNYYYLPDEDMAIHKTLALYVDKEHRQKAAKENCYSKRIDTYVITYEPLDEEAFKTEYGSDIYFVPICKLTKSDEDYKNKLVSAVIRHFLK